MRVVGSLKNFIAKHPNHNLIIPAEFNIARLYMAKEEYDKARAHLKEVMKKYSKSQQISSEALFLIANSYEIENKWGQALQDYKSLIERFPKTIMGMNTPLYVANYYKTKHQPDKMRGALQEALQHYQGLISSYPNSPLALNSYGLVVKCYAELEEWQNAAATYETVIETFKSKMKMDAMLIQLAAVYMNNLQDRPKAIETLNKMMAEYPNSGHIKTAKMLLEKWSKK